MISTWFFSFIGGGGGGSAHALQFNNPVVNNSMYIAVLPF